MVSVSLDDEVLRDDANGRVELRYRPLGVVGAIAPWNMPIVLSVPKITHALYTGNALVLKPSPYTPLATLRLGEIAADLFPAGVLSILAGFDKLGQGMSEHAGIDKISFTGSIATGKKVMASAAVNLKRLTLELGGNDAAIVLEDADVAAIAQRLFDGAFVNSGQVCMAIKRLYVHESLYDAACEALTRIAAAVRVGDGFNPKTQLGPVQNKAQFEIVKGVLQDTQATPAVRILTGGRPIEGPGYFVPPTLVADIAEGTRLVDEEPFGPVLPIIRYKEVADAVQRANRTSYGLGASVWGRNTRRATEVAGSTATWAPIQPYRFAARNSRGSVASTEFMGCVRTWRRCRCLCRLQCAEAFHQWEAAEAVHPMTDRCGPIGTVSLRENRQVSEILSVAYIAHRCTGTRRTKDR